MRTRRPRGGEVSGETDYCRTITEGGRRYHIPGCMGCATSGSDRCRGCTCDGEARKRSIENRLATLERKVAGLAARAAREAAK